MTHKNRETSFFKFLPSFVLINTYGIIAQSYATPLCLKNHLPTAFFVSEREFPLFSFIVFILARISDIIFTRLFYNMFGFSKWFNLRDCLRKRLQEIFFYHQFEKNCFYLFMFVEPNNMTNSEILFERVSWSGWELLVSLLIISW